MQFLTRFSLFIGKTFAYWTLAFAVLGFFVPAFFVGFNSLFGLVPALGLGKSIIPYLLGIIMFGMGLTLTLKDFSQVAEKPLYVLLGVVAQFIVMPSLALLLVTVFKLDPLLAVGVLLVGCCPGGTSSNVITYLSKGDVPLSVTVTSITTLMAPVVTPFLLSQLAGETIAIEFLPMMISIIQVVILPIFLGVGLRMLLKEKIDRITPILPIISVFGIILIVAIVVAGNKAKLLEVGLLIIAIVMLHNLLGYAIGYVAAKVFGLKLAQRKAIAVEVGMQNSGLGVTLASIHFAANPIVAVPSALFSVWHNISGALLANFFVKLEEKEPAAIGVKSAAE